MGPMETIHLNALGLKKYCQTYGETITNVSKTMGAIPSAWLMQTDEDKSKVFCICLFKEKQVGSPTKARAGFLKIGLPLNWEAAVGFTKWGTVIFSDLVNKGRLARLD